MRKHGDFDSKASSSYLRKTKLSHCDKLFRYYEPLYSLILHKQIQVQVY